MKRILSMIAALIMCFAAVASVVSAEDFVPSITYKDGPDVEDAVMKEEQMENCIVVTSILAAKNKTTDIYQEARDLLLDTYNKLGNNSMSLPIPEQYVVRELVDVSFKKTPCVEGGHDHEDELAKPDVDIIIDFKLGVKATTKVEVVHYHEGKWEPVKSVKNNGDGTVTVAMEHFCPVAFCVDPVDESGPAQTGDQAGNDMIIWIVLLAVSLVVNLGLLVYLILRMQKKKKK